MILCAINRKEPYLSQLNVLRKSMKRNSPGEVRRFDVLDVGMSREYMVCHRTKMFADAIQDGVEKVAWMDADCIIRKPLEAFWEDVEENTLKILYRPKKKPNRRFQAAVFAFGNGEYVKQLVDEWNEVVQKRPEWYKDQEELYKCWKRHKKHVRLIEMDGAFNDSTFNKDSTIWHSKGHHFKDPRFQKEWKMYRKEAG